MKLKWDDDSNEAFKLMLDSISNTVALHHIDYNSPLHLQVDASKLEKKSENLITHYRFSIT